MIYGVITIASLDIVKLIITKFGKTFEFPEIANANLVQFPINMNGGRFSMVSAIVHVFTFNGINTEEK